MARYCAKCGAEVTEGSKFCKSCGAPVGDTQQGAYNLYEQETRMDIVIMQLDDIYEELEEIKENQYMLYDAICQTNYMLSQIADDAAVAAYNTEVIITNQRICQRYYMV